MFKKSDGGEYPHSAWDISMDTYMAGRLLKVEQAAVWFTNKYGFDFNAFFYRSSPDEFIKQEDLPIQYQDGYSQLLRNDYWEEKHPFNFPGPFYTGYTDNCGTGNPEAPFNVLYDGNGQEYLFRQPQTYTELLCVMDAGACDPFDAYAGNGNNHWTYPRCKDWWKGKADLLHRLADPEVRETNGISIERYIHYLNNAAGTDLRKYCYFIEHGVYPTKEVKSLPPL